MKIDLVKLQECRDRRQLKLNQDNCVTMHIGHRSPNVKFEFNGRELKSTDAEKDLGVLI